MKTAITYGVIGGLVVTALSVLVYTINPEIYEAGWYGVVSWIIPLDSRACAGGSWQMRREHDRVQLWKGARGLIVTALVAGGTMSLVATVWQIHALPCH